jgi:uncharacterized protein
MSIPPSDAVDTRHEWIDVDALARRAEPLAGRFALARLPRLLLDAPGLPQRDPAAIDWQVRAEWRDPPPAVAAAVRALAGGRRAAVPRQLWLHLRLAGAVPLVCQRCLEPYWQPLTVDRWFRFVADEATAEAQDESCEEDLLVLSGTRYPLRELVEDELLLAAPLVPMHDICPHPIALARGDALTPAAADAAESAEERRRPFEALAALKARRS